MNPAHRESASARRDIIPHLEFWQDLPGLALDGLKFTWKQGRQAFKSMANKVSHSDEVTRGLRGAEDG